jgi:hypothetical protein
MTTFGDDARKLLARLAGNEFSNPLQEDLVWRSYDIRLRKQAYTRWRLMGASAERTLGEFDLLDGLLNGAFQPD